MIDPATSTRWLYRLLFVALAAGLLFLHLLPLDSMPSRFAGPDLMLCLAFAWVQRRPDFLPPLLLAAVFLMSDLLLMRPPGLWTTLVLLGAEFLRSRHQGSSEMPFPAEWAFTSAVIVAISLGYILILSLAAANHAAPAQAVIQAVMTVLFYPLIVLLTHFAFKLHRPAPGDGESRGALR